MKQTGELYQMSQEESVKQSRYKVLQVPSMQHDYDYLIDLTRDLMRIVSSMANAMINARNRAPSTMSFTLHRQFFLNTKNKSYKLNKAYAQLIINETDWYEKVINSKRDIIIGIDMPVTDYNGIIYPHPAFDDRIFLGDNKIYELKKELEPEYPELSMVDDSLWSIIDYIKRNSHIKMSTIQKIKFQEIVSNVGIQLPDFMYLATSIQKFLERFHEIFC